MSYIRNIQQNEYHVHVMNSEYPFEVHTCYCGYSYNEIPAKSKRLKEVKCKSQRQTS